MPVLSHHCYRCPVLFNDLGRVHLFKKKKAKLLKVKFKCHLGKAGQFLSVFFFFQCWGVASASADAGRGGMERGAEVLKEPLLKAMSKPFWILPVQRSSLEV